MKIHHLNATTLLHLKAKSLLQSHDSWRAIYFNFSTHTEVCSDGLRTHFVVEIIKELLAEDEGFVYLCEDRDIVILFQGQVKPIMEKLGSHIQGLEGNRAATPQPQDNLVTVFDLSRHWQIFFDLCESKTQDDEPVEAHKPEIPFIPEAAFLEPDEQLFQAAKGKRMARRRLNVLVVEDEAFTRRLIVGALRDHFDVIEAESGSEAFAAYSLNAPDLVFLDIELPDINGQVVLQKLIHLDPQAFIVMLSGSSFKENILAALEVGAQGFVTKPFAKEKLMHYLKLRENVQQRAGVPFVPQNYSQENRI